MRQTPLAPIIPVDLPPADRTVSGTPCERNQTHAKQEKQANRTPLFLFQKARHSPSGPFGFSGADGRFFRLFVETAGTGKRAGAFRFLCRDEQYIRRVFRPGRRRNGGLLRRRAGKRDRRVRHDSGNRRMAGRPGRNNRSRRFRNTDGGDGNGRRVQSGFKDDDCYGVRDDQGNHRTNRGSPLQRRGSARLRIFYPALAGGKLVAGSLGTGVRGDGRGGYALCDCSVRSGFYL